MIMEERKKHIQSRNLVVAETFDEFVHRCEDIDFTVEDVVGYVTSVSRVFYWNNVESVWGVLGFVWDSQTPLSDEEALIYPNPQYRLNQVDAAGNVIEMDNQWLLSHKTNKGYGHFVTTTMPFNIIPELPDGYRITELRYTFRNVASDNLVVQKSDWSNLKNVSGLARAGQSINIDLTGAPLDGAVTSANNILIGSETGTWKATVYIKGDLSHCLNTVVSYRDNGTTSDGTCFTKHTILLDKDNLGLNLPWTMRSGNIYYCTNKDTEFDITNWLSMEGTPRESYVHLLAASKKYKINWKYVEAIQAANGRVIISPFSSIDVAPENDNTIRAIVDPIAEELVPDTITIDTHGSTGNVNESNLAYLSTSIASNVYHYNTRVWNPLIYDGEVNSITMWNPYVVVKDDNSWPEYDQSMIDKLVPSVYDTVRRGYFMFGSYLYITQPCPYTVDCTHLEYLNLFARSHFYVSDFSNFYTVGSSKVINLINLTNANNFISFSYDRESMTQHTGEFWLEMPSIKTVLWNYSEPNNSGRAGLYIPSTKRIEAAYFPNSHYAHIRVESSAVPVLKIRHIDCKQQYNTTYTAKFIKHFDFINTPGNVYNYIGFEDGLLEDTDFLKNAYIETTYFKNGAIIQCPFVKIDGEKLSIRQMNFTFDNNDQIIIYKSSIECYAYNTDALAEAFMPTLRKIIAGIWVNDTSNTYTITLSNKLYDRLTSEEKDYIINTLHYTLEERLD